MPRGRKLLCATWASAIGVLNLRCQRAHVPFTEVTGGVALRLESFVDCEFPITKMAVIGCVNSGAVMVPSRHH